jgi:hypothetical protein
MGKLFLDQSDHFGIAVSVHHGQVAGQPVELSARSHFCLAAMIRLARETFLRSAL